MFKKFLLISLVCIGVTAFMVSQASAGCCCNPRWCCWCLPGSLSCRVMSTGLGPIYKECQETEAEGDCPAGSLTIFGTMRPQGKKYTEDLHYCSNFDPTNRETWTDCAVLMTIDCENPDPHAPKKPKGTAVSYNYPYPMESGTVAFSCDKNGNCKEYILFEPELPEDLCKSRWTYLGSTLDSYIQNGDFCKGGWVCPEGSFSAGGGAQCCKDGAVLDDDERCAPEDEVLDGRICCGEAGRNLAGGCATPNVGMINGFEYPGFSGGPTRIFEVCRYVDPDPNIPDNEYYNCKPCVPLTWDDTVSPAKVTSWDCPAE
ncbi:MAG: hypothetical protein IMF11_10495 [Proteobacteria bacterium]|nr:hypothetical protein [Pseudomonadota bacterium]